LFTDVLRSLKHHSLIDQDSEGSIVLGHAGERITDNYEFYAAFVTRDEYTVRHNANTIGFLPAAELPRPTQHIILGGRRWRVDQIHRDCKVVDVTPAKAGSTPTFLGNRGDIHTIVFKEMQAVLWTDEVPVYLDHRARTMLSAARLAADQAGLNDQEILQAKDKIAWYPWIGTRGLLTLQLFADHDGIKCEPDDLSLNYQEIGLERFAFHLQKILSGDVAGDELSALMPEKRFNKFDRYLEAKILDRANAVDRLDLESARHAAAAGLAELKKKPSVECASHPPS
jgi:ATP-dependent Lhr-like helicase